MDDLLARNWPWILLRGAAALLFGVLTLFYPEVTLAALVLLFGTYALADGLFKVMSAIANRRGEQHWLAVLTAGVTGITAGAVTFFIPDLALSGLLLLLAGWAIVSGILEVVAALRLRRLIEDEWRLALAGALTVAIGVLMAALPLAGTVAIALWIGAWAITLGGLLIALALRLRRWHRGHGAVFA